MTDAAVRAELEASFGEPGAAIDDLMRARHPRARPFDRLSRAYGATIRQSAVTQATRKAAAGRAPAYLYWFTWQTPVMGGRPRAFHCAELPFVFHAASRCPRLTGGGPEALDLADRVADAWIAFARNGAPNHPGLPDWPPFDAASVPTMVFDTPCVMLSDPDGAERALTGEA
jgi:para-nitrobenzyl esterase